MSRSPAGNLAHFLMVGRTAQRRVRETPETVLPQAQLMLTERFNLAEVLPDETREAFEAAESYKLLFVFENYLRDFILTVLSEKDKDNWWNAVPKDVQDEVAKAEETEDRKKWMNLDSRGKLALTTLPQLMRIMDEPDNWKTYFEPLVRDKSLLQHTRLIVHTRNTICHMTAVSAEENERIRQVVRDWFRVVAP
jgi:hypothetical protein